MVDLLVIVACTFRGTFHLQILSLYLTGAKNSKGKACGVTCQSRRGPGQRGDWQMANDRRAAASEAWLNVATCVQS